MLTPVGIVDDGRVSQDTGHSFDRSKEAAPGIAARYYMHRNFFINDPDAFTVSRQLVEERELQRPLSLNEAEVSIALAAVSGGMYEIGDDLPTLGSDAERLALVQNTDLLLMAKLGRAATPIDLLSYNGEDEQPSVFSLREDPRQSILAVFNWTEKTRSHRLSFAELGLAAGRKYDFKNILEPPVAVSAGTDSIDLEQPARSVRLIKITDNSIPAAAPSVKVRVPDQAEIDEDIPFDLEVDPAGVPAIAYRWDFGDGTTEDGRHVRHAYTMAGHFTVRLVVDGVDGVAAEKQAQVAVNGSLSVGPPTRYDKEQP